MRTRLGTAALVALYVSACGSGAIEDVDAGREPSDAGSPDARDADGGPCEPFALAFIPSNVMRPGVPCLDCHDETHETPLTVAGTVFDRRHAADDCRGVQGAEVRVVDVDGVEHRLFTTLSGNFYSDAPLAFPIRIRLVDETGEREMTAPAEHGNCNACHTVDGSMGAPGRIVAPAFVP